MSETVLKCDACDGNGFTGIGRAWEVCQTCGGFGWRHPVTGGGMRPALPVEAARGAEPSEEDIALLEAILDTEWQEGTLYEAEGRALRKLLAAHRSAPSPATTTGDQT